MTPEEIDAGLDEIRDWLDDYPEGTVVALFDARAWEVKGYADWDSLLEAEVPGRRIQLPRPERREIVGRMADAGMTTRAIASAVGVDHSTVARDLAGVANATPRTGLDGKTYPASRPATITRTEVVTEQIVDLDTGEVLNDLVTSEQWEAEQAVQTFIHSSGDIRAANLRADFAKWLNAVHRAYSFDPAEMADIYPERADDVAARAEEFATWATAYAASIKAANGLRIVKGI